jgi:hypothetical protein
MVDATDVLSGLEIRPALGPVSTDSAWLVEFAKFVGTAYDRAILGDSLELQALIRHVTRHFRSEDVPPERTLTAVKALLPTVPRVWDTHMMDARRVRDDAIRWCIAEYFAPDYAPRELSRR